MTVPNRASGSNGFAELNSPAGSMAFTCNAEVRFRTEKEFSMRRFRVFGCACLTASLIATAAHAQYGLYGAPDPLRMPPAQPAAASAPTVYMQAPVAVAPVQPVPAAAVAQPAAPKAALFSPGVSPAYTVPANPATTRPVQTPYVARYTSANAQQQYAARAVAPQTVPQMAAGAPRTPTPAAPPPVPTPATLEEPPETPVAAPNSALVTPSPSDAAQGNLMNSMLAQPSCGAPSYYAGGCQQYERAACGGCNLSGCNSCCPWYGSVMVLSMGRDQPNGVWTSFQANLESNQLTNTRDCENRWQWGGEVTIGRKFCGGCNTFGIQATYWTLSPTTGETITTNAAGVSTPLITEPTLFDTDPTGDWFAGADMHRLRRYNEYHNGEVNFVGFRNASCEYQSVWGLDWLMGFRYFRFQESLDFASLRQGGSWDVPTEWAHLNDNIENNLWGFQIGANADLRLTQCLKLFFVPKVGIYDNHIVQNYTFARGDGFAATTGGAYPEPAFPVHSSTDTLSFLTELNLGLDWQISCRWSARVGYRVVAATGIGLADNQIPMYLVDVPEISHIDTNGQLILHGAFAGVTYNF